MASFVEEKIDLWSHNDLVKDEQFSSSPHRQNVGSVRADDVVLPGWRAHISPTSISLVHHVWLLLTYWSGQLLGCFLSYKLLGKQESWSWELRNPADSLRLSWIKFFFLASSVNPLRGFISIPRSVPKPEPTPIFGC